MLSYSKAKFLRIPLFALIFCCTLNGNLSAKVIKGITLPGKMVVHDHKLVLNGAGVRTKGFVLDIYVAGLYLTEKKKNADPDKILAVDEPIAVRINLISSLVEPKDMRKSTLKSLKNSTKGKMKPIQKEVDIFLSAFSKDIKKGDMAELIYEPEIGLTVNRNGKEIVVIKCGFEFRKAIFGMWLCDKPAHKKLKKKMLNQ